MKFDRERFFNGFRDGFGELEQAQTDALNKILASAEADTDITCLRWIAYILATIKRECGETWSPTTEQGNPRYFGKYEPGSRLGKMLGNTQSGDGARFHGRGYVQLTGRRNYAKAKTLTGADLLNDPAQAKDPALAYEIATQGMIDGWFTGRKLSQFMKDGQSPDFENARTIINGHDKAANIADIARRFSEVLLAAAA